MGEMRWPWDGGEGALWGLSSRVCQSHRDPLPSPRISPHASTIHGTGPLCLERSLAAACGSRHFPIPSVASPGFHPGHPPWLALPMDAGTPIPHPVADSAFLGITVTPLGAAGLERDGIGPAATELFWGRIRPLQGALLSAPGPREKDT